jgi:hypothetical protein
MGPVARIPLAAIGLLTHIAECQPRTRRNSGWCAWLLTAVRHRVASVHRVAVCGL